MTQHCSESERLMQFQNNRIGQDSTLELRLNIFRCKSEVDDRPKFDGPVKQTETSHPLSFTASDNRS